MATIRSIINGFLGLKKDPTATTQDVAVIKAEDTNAGIVLKPNGTGAIMASVPDGTTVGGNARGQYAVDLKTGGRTSQTQVASGNYSAVIGGNVSTASGVLSLAGGSAFATGAHSVALGGSSFASGSGSVAIGGEEGGGLGATASGRAAIAFGLSNTATANFSNSLGGLNNNATSQYSTVSGGQSNTASTNSHSTVVGGQGNTASGLWSLAGGGQSAATGQSSICFGSESQASGTQSYVLGRLCRATGYASVALGYGADTNSKSYSNVFGGGGKSGNNNENIFANSVNQTNEGVTQRTGYYQRRLQIVGANSQNKGAVTPTGQTIPSATTWGLSTTFNFLSLPTQSASYTPLYDNVYFTFESTITMAVNIINGTATGVSVGDYKIGKLLATGKKYGGVYTVISTTFTVLDESASMGTSTFELAVASNGNFYIKFTAPTFAGGGDLDLTIMADNTITEMKQNL